MIKDNILFNNKKKIVLSPHCDDFILSLGGIALRWSKSKVKLEDLIIFSNSNYLVNDDTGNSDISKSRIKIVSSIRLREEQSVMKRLGNIKIRPLKQDEALVRGHYIEKQRGERFPRGFYEKKDKKATDNVYKLLAPLFSKNIQLFAPLAIQGHIDHLIIRETVLKIIQSKKIKAQVFFYEDLPYAAYATKKEWKEINNFIKQNKLIPIVTPVDIDSKLDLLDYYSSQLVKRDYAGVVKRAGKIKNTGNYEQVYLYGSK